MKTYSALRGRLHTLAPANPSLDLEKVTETIQRALASAGLDTQSGPMRNVTDTIQQALSGVGLQSRPVPVARRGPTGDVADAQIVDIDDFSTARRTANSPRPGGPLPGRRSAESGQGQFLSRSLTNHAGTRAYKLYVPASYVGEPMPMIVMLHGCTQSPDDFAAGTRMNALAELHGFLVVYPAQAADANCSKCWNWFQSQDQLRDNGEPALIADITREVADIYRVDERRIFVAGLSAGAAMAVILGATYPDLYAAVGAHSGLPYGAAHDMVSAFSAMKGSRASAGIPGTGSATAEARLAHGVPTIVFHGDRDHTVDARNGVEIVERATAGVAGGLADSAGGRTSVEHETSAHGRSYDRIVHSDAAGRPVVEHWILHGAGHAWSGGSPAGSFTDPSGPDASAEMIRFFYSQQRAGSA